MEIERKEGGIEVEGREGERYRGRRGMSRNQCVV